MARHIVSDSAPPCERGANHKDRCECLVAKVREGGARVANMLSKLAQSMIVASCGPQMAAVVFDKGTDECFLVVLQPLSTTTAAAASLKARIGFCSRSGVLTLPPTLARCHSDAGG